MYIVLMVSIIYPCASQFFQGSSRLPRPDDAIAIGYDANTDSILLLGGDGYRNAFVTFQDHNFNNIGSSYLSEQAFGYSQYYTQLNDELWLIGADGQMFITMDTITHTVTVPSITIPNKTSNGACLASVPGYLLVVGGGSSRSSCLGDTQIYRFNDNQWLPNVPDLPSRLTSTSCAVVNNKLYVIGGYDGSAPYDTIYYLDIANLDQISTQSWHTLNGRLPTPREATRAVVHGTDIYVIGGYDYDAVTAHKDVYLIDTLTGSCTVHSDDLPYTTSYAASIVVNDVLYVFGGYGNDYLDKYSYKALPPLTSDPTKAPTLYPTKALTIYPTETPTLYPTANPTKAPTHNPTNEPTSFPTEAPIHNPTKAPTANPSKLPTNIATSNTNTGYSTEDTTDYDETESKLNDSDTINAVLTTPWVYAVTIALIAMIVILSLFVCGFGLYFYYYVKRTRSVKQIKKMANSVKPHAIEPILERDTEVKQQVALQRMLSGSGCDFERENDMMYSMEGNGEIEGNVFRGKVDVTKGNDTDTVLQDDEFEVIGDDVTVGK